jgi:hypothetical protein
MTDFEIGWVTGILEGEGTFQATNFPNARQPLARIWCGMTDEDVICRLREVTGVGRVTGPYLNKQEPDYKPKWIWQVSRNDDALNLMLILQPHMGQRRQAQIDLVISKCPPLFPRHSGTHCSRGHSLADYGIRYGRQIVCWVCATNNRRLRDGKAPMTQLPPPLPHDSPLRANLVA